MVAAAPLPILACSMLVCGSITAMAFRLACRAAGTAAFLCPSAMHIWAVESYSRRKDSWRLLLISEDQVVGLKRQTCLQRPLAPPPPLASDLCGKALLTFQTCARHAFGDQYRATDLHVTEPGKLELVFTPNGGGQQQKWEVHQFDGAGVGMGMYNTEESIQGFAKASFEYALMKQWYAHVDLTQR